MNKGIVEGELLVHKDDLPDKARIDDVVWVVDYQDKKFRITDLVPSHEYDMTEAKPPYIDMFWSLEELDADDPVVVVYRIGRVPHCLQSY